MWQEGILYFLTNLSFIRAKMFIIVFFLRHLQFDLIWKNFKEVELCLFICCYYFEWFLHIYSFDINIEGRILMNWKNSEINAKFNFNVFPSYWSIIWK